MRKFTTRIAILVLVTAPMMLAAGGRSVQAQVIPGIGSTFPTSFWGVPVPVPTAPPAVPTTSPTTTSTVAPLHPRGVEPLDPAAYAKLAMSFAPAMGNLPASTDLSTSFPPPGDQGKEGSCVAWAIAYGLKSYEEHDQNSWMYTKDHLFSPAFVYNSMRKGNCKGGLVIQEAFQFVEHNGVSPLSTMPYDASDCATQPSAEAKAVAKNFRLNAVRRVDADLVEIKGHIASDTPVVIGMKLDASFDDLKGQQVYGGAKGPFNGSHAMVIAGYDDARGAVRVLNSWGTSLGDKGFGWISYAALMNQADEFYIAKSFDAAPAPSPSPDPTPEPKPPPPVAKAPKATLSKVSTMKNVLVADTYYFGVAASGSIENGAGKKYQLVVRFEKGGTPIKSTDAKYADAHGNLAAGTPPSVLGSNSFSLAGAPSIAIPQLTLKTSLGSKSGDKVDVDAYYDAYVDGFHVARSPKTTVTFNWN